MLADIALLVLENPWDTPQRGTRRLSVLPFFEGLERIHGNMAVYHSTFHSLDGLREALDYDLRLTREPRQVLYVGSHGQGRMLKNIRFADLRKTVRERADRLEGVIISSCEICRNCEDLMDLVRGTGIRWAVGYKCPVSWFDSMLIELALLNALAEAPVSYKGNLDSLEVFFQEALQILNRDYVLDPAKGRLADNVTIVISSRSNAQPRVLAWPTAASGEPAE
ncbi:hypothetical protein [Hymenobacter psychrophilus]|uniref:CHAT domain-containing protein n=1 Tax=Hymenobacter psychrophilus TaxID=651662 RepID=A0A1H3KXK9_9BACT|nr:hypothetical protein [Hymenobacter psychrophilus]SDY56766.1 hypothetical protein SAMN04488069_1106 [Hymenobacter psychrophilus]